MNSKRLHILTFFLLSWLEAMAQYDAHFNHYWALEPLFNPATVGKNDKVNVVAAYSMSLTGFENNPKTMYAGGDLPLRMASSVHGVGVMMMNDDVGLFVHKNLAVQYSFSTKLFGGTLSIGAKLGMLSEGFEGSNVDMETPDDPAFPSTDVTGSSLDVGLGAYYRYGKWYLGLSGQHLNSPKVEIGEKQEIDVSCIYYFTSGYNIQLRNPFLSIQPTVLCSTDGVAWRADISGRMTYTNDNKLMYAGLSYSPTNSITFMVGGVFHGVCIGYSYEAYTTDVSLGNGGHELFVGYQTKINLGKKGKNLHKSVRLL